MTTKLRTLDLVYIATFTSLITVCAWTSLAFTVPFTLQTFGVFLTLLLLGGKRGTYAVLVYLLLGAVGAPVFAGFSGGIGILFGSTGGYLLGFLGTTLLYWALVKKDTTSTLYRAAILLAGLALCYALGTVWFVMVYTSSTGAVGVGTALG